MARDNADRWLSITGSHEVPAYGFERYAEPAPLEVNTLRLLSQFHTGSLTLADTWQRMLPSHDQGVGHGKTVATAHIPDLAPAPTSVLARPPTPRPSATSRPRPISTASQRPTASRSAPESGIRTASHPLWHTSSPRLRLARRPTRPPRSRAGRHPTWRTACRWLPTERAGERARSHSPCLLSPCFC